MALLDRATQQPSVREAGESGDHLGGPPRRVLRVIFFIRVQSTRGRAMTNVVMGSRNTHSRLTFLLNPPTLVLASDGRMVAGGFGLWRKVRAPRKHGAG
jgi:hypothetical protein